MRISRTLLSTSLVRVQIIQLFAFALGLILTNPAEAQCERDKLVASDPDFLDLFGWSVDLDGDTAIAGAPEFNPFLLTAGSAYIFQPDGNNDWQEVAILTPSDGFELDFYGHGVSISGDFALVGGPFDDDLAGGAFIFERNAGGPNLWGEVQKLVAADRAAGDRFGWNVSIDGDTAIISAYRDDDLFVDSGSAYIFQRNKKGIWNEIKKLTAPVLSSGAQFGYAVSIHEDYAIVGANVGNAVYIFQRDQGGSDNWGVVATFAGTGEFGFSVAIRDNLAIVGAPYTGDGAAFIYRRDNLNTWAQVANLLSGPPSAGGEREFGFDVEIQGNTALVGARADDDNCPVLTPNCNSGATYFFESTNDGLTWSETAKFYSSDIDIDDSYGHSVAISESTALIGAPGNDDGGEFAGSAYIVDLNGPDCNFNSICDDRDIENGTSLDENNNEIPDECEADCNGNNVPDILEVTLGLVPDCNENGIPDECDIAFTASCDRNENAVPDECEAYCFADLNCNAIVNVDDLLILIGNWGPCPAKGECPADLVLNGQVNVDDLLNLIGSWGNCPAESPQPSPSRAPSVSPQKSITIQDVLKSIR